MRPERPFFVPLARGIYIKAKIRRFSYLLHSFLSTFFLKKLFSGF